MRVTVEKVNGATTASARASAGALADLSFPPEAEEGHAARRGRWA